MRINSSMKHSHMASVVSFSVMNATPFSSRGSSKSNSSLGMGSRLFEALGGRSARAGKATRDVFLHDFILGIGRHALRAGFPWAFAAQAAVFSFGYTDEALFGHRVYSMVVRLTAKNETHHGLGLVEQRVGLMHRHVPIACH